MCLESRSRDSASPLHALLLPRYCQDVLQAAQEHLLACGAGKRGIVVLHLTFLDGCFLCCA
jgi:hypothetical protein